MHESIFLKRAVTAIQIPSGDEIELPLGTEAKITQSLGGTYTIVTDHGLARVRTADADALGLDEESKKESAVEKITPEGDVETAIWEQLKSVYDPEIPVDIVNLGLVYDCGIQDVEGKKFVTVKMTLTAPGCGMGPTIAADARSKILGIEGIHEATVDLVWDPAWNQDMISEEGRMKLGMV
ncbi:MAG: putative FeS assembly SUF system protein SufT [Verrucomicrobiales bacterium]|jgi:probable FeS assembly SUF system protein SufT